MQLVNVFLLLAFNAVHAKKCANKSSSLVPGTTSAVTGKSSEVPSTLSPSPASTAPLTSKTTTSSSAAPIPPTTSSPLPTTSSAAPIVNVPPTTQKAPTTSAALPSTSSAALPSTSSVAVPPTTQKPPTTSAALPTTSSPPVPPTTQKPPTTSAALPTTSAPPTTQKPSSTTSFALPVPSNNLVVTPDPLDCKPLAIVDEANYKYSLECRLGQQPNSTTNMYVSGGGLRFDKCGLTFTTSNWNVYQPLNVYTIPDTAGNNTVRSLNLSARTFGSGVYNNKNFQLPYTRKAFAPASCSFSGDPHFTPFSVAGKGAPFSFYGLGPYTIIDSPLGLRVIANYYRCNPNVSCTGGISIQYHDAHYLVTVEGKTTRISTLTVYSLGTSTAGTSFSYATDKKTVTFNLEDGSRMSVAIGWSGSLSFSSTLSAIYHKNVKGHCNVYDSSIPANTLYFNNTAFNVSRQAEINTFGNGFKVLTSDNCFLGNCSKPAGIKPMASVIPGTCTLPTSVTTTTFPSVPALPAQYNPCDFVYANCTSSPTIVKRDIIEEVADKPCDLSYDDAEDMCIQAIDTLNCDSVVKVMPFVQACVLDSMAICGYGFIADHKNAYAAACKAQTDLMIDNDDESVAAKGQAVQNQNGFGTSTCPDQCNGNGVCTDFGCSCAPGFTGAACDVNLKELDINASSNTLLLSNGQKVN